jgi:hypothetical protein
MINSPTENVRNNDLLTTRQAATNEKAVNKASKKGVMDMDSPEFDQEVSLKKFRHWLLI